MNLIVKNSIYSPIPEINVKLEELLFDRLKRIGPTFLKLPNLAKRLKF